MIRGTNKVSLETKKYPEFCKTFGPKQLIKSPTRVTPKPSNEKITQCEQINIGLSDHQMIFLYEKN